VAEELRGINVTNIGKHRGSLYSIIVEANLIRFIQLLIFIHKKKIDFGVSVGGFILGAALKFRNKPNIQFDDDPESSKNLLLEKITADEIHIPPILDEAGKFVVFNALKEWAYLSPEYFKPNAEIPISYGLIPYEYLFFREVSSGSLNYMDQGSFTIASFSQKLNKNLIIILSLKKKKKRHLYPAEWIILEEPVNDIHSLMYYSKILISSGDSMAREGSMLGCPSIYCGKRKMKANNLMVKEGSFFHLKPEDVPDFIGNINKLNIPFSNQNDFRVNLKNKWDDVTKHILKTINRIV
jgi:predicted glycosyltransferase